MAELENKLQGLVAATHNQWVQPQIFDIVIENDRHALGQLVDAGRISFAYDTIAASAVPDLYDIAYPHEKDSTHKPEAEAFATTFNDSYGNWVFFPWSGRLVRFPLVADLRALRTSRNRNLITAEEQSELYAATVAVIGLSVGSNVIDALVLQGIAGTILFADNDTLEPSNLNRIRAAYAEVGDSKVDHVAKKISETDPYLRQIHYHDGLTEQNLTDMIAHAPAVIVDEMDDIKMKIRLRKLAKEHKIAIISAADDGDDTLIDIERYDLDQSLELFNGLIPAEVLGRIEQSEQIPRAELGMIIGKYFIGAQYIPLRMFQSLGEVGKTIPSWPQLGGAAVLAGVVAAYCARKIILGQPLRSGRYVVGPDLPLNPDIQTATYKAALQPFIDRLG